MFTIRLHTLLRVCCVLFRLSQSPSLLISGSSSWPQNIKNLPFALHAREKNIISTCRQVYVLLGVVAKLESGHMFSYVQTVATPNQMLEVIVSVCT